MSRIVVVQVVAAEATAVEVKVKVSICCLKQLRRADDRIHGFNARSCRRFRLEKLGSMTSHNEHYMSHSLNSL